MKRVLVTNDDGINAKGIIKLTEYLSDLAEVYVVAPSRQQSAKSQSITFLTPVDIEKVELAGATVAVALSGTPTDCVIWGISHFRKEGIEFDYVFSGINMGANIGLAAYYSGTISAAKEGALHGVRSIALSVESHEASEFDYILSTIPAVMKMADSLSPATILSVNAPNLPADQVKGLRIAAAAPWGYGENYRFHKTEAGVYQMSQFFNGTETAGLDYDFDCLHNGYASISPLITHISDDEALRILNERF